MTTPTMTREGDQGRPPRQAERADEREGAERGQHPLDRDDRDLGGDQRGDLRRLVGRRAAQHGDPRGRAELGVDQAAEVAEPARAEQPAARDRRARRLDAGPPRLAARDEREHLQRGREGQHPQRRRLQRLGELVALVGERDREHDGDRQCARGSRRSAAASLPGHWWRVVIRSARRRPGSGPDRLGPTRLATVRQRGRPPVRGVGWCVRCFAAPSTQSGDDS